MKATAILILQSVTTLIFTAGPSTSVVAPEVDATGSPDENRQRHSAVSIENEDSPKEVRVLRRQLVYVGTNRVVTNAMGAFPMFGDKFGPVRYAKCDVVVGDEYQHGQLVDIKIRSIDILNGSEELPNGKSSKSVLVYVHGFCVTLEESVRRATQIAHELNYEGSVIAYSWPTAGPMTPRGYVADVENVRHFTEPCRSFLKSIARRFGSKKVQVLAHSLGCRLVADSVVENSARLDDKTQVATERLANLILAAPDMRRTSFCDRYVPSLKSSFERVTVYFSTRDRVLAFAERIDGGQRRLGRAGIPPSPEAGIELVDYSAIPGGFMNLRTHGYFREHPMMIQDIQSVLSGVVPVSRRRLHDEQQILSSVSAE